MESNTLVFLSSSHISSIELFLRAVNDDDDDDQGGGLGTRVDDPQLVPLPTN